MKITKATIRQEITAHLGLEEEYKKDDDLLALAILYLLKQLTPNQQNSRKE